MIIKYKSRIIFAVIVIVAVLSRWVNLGYGFSHIDDLIIPSLIQDSLDLGRPGNVGITRIQSRLGDIIGNNGTYEYVLHWVGVIYPYVAVPFSQTYAPIIYTPLPLFLDINTSYRDAVLIARIPSFISALISLILIFVIAHDERISKGSFSFKFLFLSLVVASHEFYIYSKFSAPYSAGILACCLWIYFLMNFEKINKFYIFIFISIMPLLSFQALFLMPGVFLSIIMTTWRPEKKETGGSAILNYTILIAVIFVIACIYLIFMRKFQGSGLNYNAGVNGEFVFKFSSFDSLTGILYVFRFFFVNSALAVANILLPIPTNGSNALVFGSISNFICFIGLIRMIFSNNFKIKTLAWSFIVVLITWFGLVAAGMTALSPTRHALIYMPIFALLFSFALAPYNKYYSKFSDYFSVFIATVFLCLSFAQILNSKFLKNDFFNEEITADILLNRNVEMVISDFCSYEASLMPKIHQKITTTYSCGGALRFRGPQPTQPPYRVAYISHIRGLNLGIWSDIVAKIETVFGQKFINPDLNCWSQEIVIANAGSYDLETLDHTATKINMNGQFITILEKKPSCDY